MRKLLKIFFTLLVVLIIAAIALPFLIPVDTYKQEIAAQVKSATGRDLVIGGAMSARVFPAIGITVENASLSNPEGFAEKTMLQMEKLAIEVELMPLFSKQIRVKRFVLDKPVINLEVNGAGKPNWQFTSPQAPAASEAAQETTDKKANTMLAGLVLGDIKITNGQIAYHDAQAKKSYALSDVNLQTAFSGLSSPFEAKGDAVWNGEKVALETALEKPNALVSAQSSPFMLSVSSAPVAFKVRGTASLLGIDGDAELKIPSLPKLVNWTGGAFDWKGTPPLAFSLQGALNCNPTTCSLGKATLALDDNKATGDMRFGFSGKPSVNGKLAFDTLDLNPYFPKSAAHNGWFVSPAYALEPWSSEKIDLSGLNAANADVDITTGSLLYNKMKLGKTSLALTLQNGAMKVSMPKAEFYGGSVSASSTLNAGGAFTKQVTIANAQIDPFLRDAADSDRFSGVMNMSGNFSGRLTSIRGMVESLSGNGSVNLTDGAVKGVDIASMIRNVQSAFREVDTTQQKTDFSELGGTFSVTNGIISNNDLAMKAPLLRLAGKGTVNLPAQTISYRLTPEIVQTAQGQGGKDKKGIQVPILVTGALDHPQFAPDVAGIAQKALENPEAIKETVKDLKVQLKENKGALKDLLGGFTGKKAKPAPAASPAAPQPAVAPQPVAAPPPAAPSAPPVEAPAAAPTAPETVPPAVPEAAPPAAPAP